LVAVAVFGVRVFSPRGVAETESLLAVIGIFDLPGEAAADIAPPAVLAGDFREVG
jgi:hypothetical protein